MIYLFRVQICFELITRKNVTIKKFQVFNQEKFSDIKTSELVAQKNLHH